MTEIAKIQNAEEFFNDLFDFSEEDPVDIKKTAIASNFSALIGHTGLSRKELAKMLDWKESRLSKVLNGSQNLTIKTMVELAVALDYDFDIHFHKATEHRSLQPWESNLLTVISTDEIEYIKMVKSILPYIASYSSVEIDQKSLGYSVNMAMNELKPILTKTSVFI